MRVLTYVPIVHSEADLGALGQTVASRFGALAGAEHAERLVKRRLSIDAMWDGITASILAMPLTWSQVRVYQDGLPNCGFELAIVEELAAKNSRNYKLLLELRRRGATLVGTEEAGLLVREYERIKRLVELTRGPSPSAQAIEAIQRDGDALLALRDAAITARILDTLQEGERGILFIGLLHRVDESLAGKLHVEHLIHNLPLGVEPRHVSAIQGES